MSKKIILPSIIIMISLGFFYFLARTIVSQASELENVVEIAIVPPEETGKYPIILEAESSNDWTDNATKVDNQGNVTVEVTPINFNTFDTNLTFFVSLNTHSVELSMDLSNLSRLVSSNGLEIPGTFWDAPKEGHHVSGNLAFDISEDDILLLNEAEDITLFIIDLDATERDFSWKK